MASENLGDKPNDLFKSSGRGRVAAEPQPSTTSTTTSRPHLWEFVLHPLRALRFVRALARDPRISLVGKALYLLVMGVLLVALLLPEGVVATAVAALLPVVGPLIAIPADATVDWLFLGAVAYALLALFPAYVVREHHARIFHPTRSRRP